MKMIQPTQDTDITSSISPIFHVQDDALSETYREGNGVKKLEQERHPTSFTMEIIYSDKRESDINGTESKYQGSELVKSLGETFPWIIKFSKVIQSAVGSKNPKLLDRLLFVYVENMSRDVNSCYSKPYRAAKLKNHISETLMFFHLYWKNIKERVDDHNQYLDKMSEILGLYVDMELKASRRGKDSASKIAAKLLTAMFIYLDNSEEHIFRILFGVKFITKNYSEICAPIFKKLFSGVSSSPKKCIADVTYVRYLLALKLWKRIKDDLQEKKKINESALLILGHRTPQMNNKLSKIIPKPPESHKNSTLWLLQPNSFDLRKACDAFVKYELNDRVISLPESIERLKIIDYRSDSTSSPQINLDSIERLKRKDILDDEEEDNNKSVNGKQKNVKKVVKFRKFKPSFPKLRPGEVLFIDLTAENEENSNEPEEEEGRKVKKKKKKDKKKLKWLKDVSKKSKSKLKLKNECQKADKIWIEKADAHSTEEDTKKNERTKTVIKENEGTLPISEDKVSESTQRIESNNDDRQKHDSKFESSEDLVTSQTSSMINNDEICLMNKYVEIERNEAARKIIKQEPRDIIMKEEDGTTDNNNCDKMIINNSSNFFNISKDLQNFKETDVPSTSSSNKNVIHSPFDNLNQIKKGKELINESCVVSTTASILEFHSDEQINVISGSCNGTLESRIRGKGSKSLDTDSGIHKNGMGGTMNSKKLFPGTKTMYRSFDTTKNSPSIDASSNNKLQNSLIQALYLDEMIEIGRDDIDSQSDDDYEDKRLGGKILRREENEELEKEEKDNNEFFQIPDIQLCDDITSDNRIENLGTTAGDGKNKVDEFENIDILDSILNGDMSMQDILEEEQNSSMINTCGNDSNANNMLGFFTEFFKQSQDGEEEELTLPMIKGDCCDLAEDSLNLNPDNGVSKSLPEGSLGMTGILNSLLDSDLTSIDSPPSDFMYSNVQTVDPRLIRRKSPTTTAGRNLFSNDFNTISDIFNQKEKSDDDDDDHNFNNDNRLTKKTKDQLFLDQKDASNSTDLEEFALNSSSTGSKETPTAFEIPVLEEEEEELIQLPQDPLIDETMITQISQTTSCESQLSSDRSENDLRLTDENNFDYTKLNNYHHGEFNCLKLKDIIQQSRTIEEEADLPGSNLTDFTPPQSVDNPQSPYNFISSPNSQTVSNSPTHSSNIRISRNIVNSNMLLTPPPSIPQQLINNQNNLITPPSTPQQNSMNINQNCNNNNNERNISSLNLNLNLQNSEIRYLSRIETKKKCKKFNKSTEIAEGDDKNQQNSSRLSDVKVSLTRLTRDEINPGSNGGEKSVLKNCVLLNQQEMDGRTLLKVTQRRELRKSKLSHRVDSGLREFADYSINGKRNDESVLIQLNGKRQEASVFGNKNNRNLNSSIRTNDDDDHIKASEIQIISTNKDNLVINNSSSKIVKHSSTSKAADKPYSKVQRKVIDINKLANKNGSDIIISGEPKSTITRYTNDNFSRDIKVISKEMITQRMIKPTTTTRRGVIDKTPHMNKKSSKGVINVRKNYNVCNNINEDNEEEEKEEEGGEPSMKKRKIIMRKLLLPNLLEEEGERNNEDKKIREMMIHREKKQQQQHSNIVIRRDFPRKDKTKKKIV